LGRVDITVVIENYSYWDIFGVMRVTTMGFNNPSIYSLESLFNLDKKNHLYLNIKKVNSTVLEGSDIIITPPKISGINAYEIMRNYTDKKVWIMFIYPDSKKPKERFEEINLAFSDPLIEESFKYGLKFIFHFGVTRLVIKKTIENLIVKNTLITKEKKNINEIISESISSLGHGELIPITDLLLKAYGNTGKEAREKLKKKISSFNKSLDGKKISKIKGQDYYMLEEQY
tara:strand:+ start:11115 stop:11804 length:690 start_codon:yes stop_codon:yes gene_type:complete